MNIHTISDDYNEFLNILALISISLIFIKFQKRNFYLNFSLALIWIIYGYTSHLEKISFDFEQNKLSLLIGIIYITTGITMIIASLNFSQLKTNQTSLITKIKLLISIILLNSTTDLFSLDKINLTFTGYILIGLNTLPMLLNGFVNKRLIKLPFELFPNPLSIITFTLFINYFKQSNSTYYIIIDILCYLMILINLTNGITIDKALLIALCLINFLLIKYLDIFSISFTESKISI